MRAASGGLSLSPEGVLSADLDLNEWVNYSTTSKTENGFYRQLWIYVNKKLQLCFICGTIKPTYSADFKAFSDTNVKPVVDVQLGFIFDRNNVIGQKYTLKKDGKIYASNIQYDVGGGYSNTSNMLFTEFSFNAFFPYASIS